MMYKNMRIQFILYTVILLEGFAVLATELIAIRQTIPFFGSGTDTISILISAVLIPLAFGYYAGGKFQPRSSAGYRPVRRKLIINILWSIPFLILGLSTLVLHTLYDFVIDHTALRSRYVLTSLYALLFIVTPVFLLGQTVPLVSQYFRRSALPKVTGHILFISTIGSFLGAVVTTVILMNTLGVSLTVSIVILGLVGIVWILSRRKTYRARILALIAGIITIAINAPVALDRIGVKAENAYNTVQIEQFGNEKVQIRHLRLNKAYSSTVNANDLDKKPTKVGQFIHWNFIKGLERANMQGQVLVIGAGGFTAGLGDQSNDYTYVDIDPDIQKNVEQYFLEYPLQDNQKFISMPARTFLRENTTKFDLVFFDVARGLTGAPEHLLTKEFFEQMADATKSGGYVVINLFASKTFRDAYSKNIDTTLRSVFPYASRQVLREMDPWGEAMDYAPVIYSARIEEYGDPVIYSDDHNTASWDRDIPLPAN